MGPPLSADIWQRRGISLVWDATALASLGPASRVASLRQLLLLHASSWASVDQYLVNEEQTLMVAGLESAMDALPPDEATAWLEKSVYPAIIGFQEEVAGGGTEAALIFWIADPKRIAYQNGDDTHTWHCGTQYGGATLPLSRCLYNGAQDGLRRITGPDPKHEQGIGLFLQRIS